VPHAPFPMPPLDPALDRAGAVLDPILTPLGFAADWRITDVRYWGYTSDRWHLAFDSDGDLQAQLSGLARTLCDEFS
jgi:hypothetical protein